jgi:hypothetical protein
MRIDGAAFGWCEAGIIVHDVEQRFVDLADVVKECDAFDRAPLMLFEACSVRDDQRVCGDASDVHAGNGIVCFNRVEQCFESGSGEATECLSGLSFLEERGAAGDRSEGSESEREVGLHALRERKKRTEYGSRWEGG